MVFENVSAKANFELGYAIYIHISNLIKKADTDEDLTLIEEMIGWYKGNIIVSAAHLEKELNDRHLKIIKL